ncbi:Pkr1p NDAI_0H02830 [Naumovozyma dairenensis CBS 421]|uniref:Pkr1p n=1 Tax=Naumovozyma dairenensis (strain ATCC 10597 / BCRC 20456 / CBS 421 / NBRC 0211 / NRRL Y-12639) TaxID=1071378 RepID=G0WF96_NAUDC|nr:hypothetical protein NDAI_0H02830 [Naumovozyma dairenensis CBS 421]CCD26457.1 hypothetical protein NDAI_0H02830 [Naumovozyma dairenensis CBS 421]
MIAFFEALWQSIFEPGTTPQLIIATHVSFIALFCTLIWLIYATKGNIHFCILLAIAFTLWIIVIWFIRELENVKLKSNEELGIPKELSEKGKDSTKKKESVVESKTAKSATTSARPKSTNNTTRSRKA